jgi:AraC-like DNA-binding protein
MLIRSDNDPLEEIFQSIKLAGQVYSHCELTAPWGISSGGCEGHAIFYIVTRGTVVLKVDGCDIITLCGGDLVLLPQGSTHTIQDAETSALSAIETLVDFANPGRLVFGGGGVKTTMVAGCFTYIFSDTHPFIKALPPVLHLTAEDVESEPWLTSTYKFIAHEANQPKQGSRLVISRLTDLLFIQVMRAHMERVKNCPATNGWFKAMSDPQINQAIVLMHSNPEAPWTVASLATAVGMSRSGFAQKFGHYTDSTPLDYLTFWRMQKAREMLSTSTVGLAEIARKVGYQSEAAFSKAFRRLVGMPPGLYRSTANERH